MSYTYTPKNAQIAASLLQACCLAVIKLISGCVCIACSGLMTTSLLHVIKLILKTSYFYKLDVSCFNNFQQVCKYPVASSLIFADAMQLDEAKRSDTTS